MSSLLTAMTNAIANPNRVRESQEKASAKALAGLDSKMRAVSDTSPECMPGVFGSATHCTTSSFGSRASSCSASPWPSRAPSRERSAPSTPATRPTIQLQRSQSEIPFKPPTLDSEQKFTPDISAMDLTSDQMKKNYSCDDLQKWDRSKNPLPPLCTMRGFGRYRRGEFADHDWHIQNIKRHVKAIEHLPGMTAGLDMEAMTGISNEMWKTLTSGNSAGSTVSSHSDASDGTVPIFEAGTRVARGFSPSSSSTRSSLFHGRKGSTLSMMNLPNEVDSPSIMSPSRRTSTLNSERRASGPLSTIAELHSNLNQINDVYKKVEKACEFSVGGDSDNAVASDVEDDEDWADVAGTNPPKLSVITQMLKEEGFQDHPSHQQPAVALKRVRTTSSDKRRSRGSIAFALDRSKTIRTARPEVRRGHSKTQSTQNKGGLDVKVRLRKSGEDSPRAGSDESDDAEDDITDSMDFLSTVDTSPEEPKKTDTSTTINTKTGLQRHHTTKRVATVRANLDTMARQGGHQRNATCTGK